MKNLKKLLVFILSFTMLLTSALCGCAKTDTPVVSESDPPPEESWTLCLFLCGSNLETKQGWATKTLNELIEADMPDNVSIVIQTGGSAKWRNDIVTSGDNKRLFVREDDFKEIGAGEFDSMGDAAALDDFLVFCAKEYPAEHTAVILWDHGGGPMKGACFDETADFDPLELDELKSAVAAGVEARGGMPYDIIGFDACLMGNIETAVTLSDHARLMVASEEIESGAGWDYIPLIEAMGNKLSAEDVARSICDGYMAKCESRGKSAAATLSVVDLSKTGAIVDALGNAVVTTKEEFGDNTKALRSIAFRTRTAETFGGSVKGEGSSNLVDLYGMAEANASDSVVGPAWEPLMAAVDDAVLYNVCGRTTSDAHGLTVWYPIQNVDTELFDYTEASPLSVYSESLYELYSSSKGAVRFSDPGTLNEDGSVSVTISPDSYDTFFDLYVVNRRKDGGYSDTNVDMADDWENLTFTYTPAYAIAITMDGMVLDAQTVAYFYDYILFSCPIKLNGEDAYMRVAWIWHSEEEAEATGHSGHYEIVGIWNGVDHVTGLSDRFLDKLEDGDTVSARSLETGAVRDTITISGEPVMDDIPMEPGEYECWFVALDMHGNEYPSDVISYEVTKDGGTNILGVG